MYLKIHESAKGIVIAACDKELMGKILEEGPKIIDLEKYRSFYVGELIDGETLQTTLKSKRFNSANLVGEKTVKASVAVGLITKSDVMKINGIPYAQIYNL